MRYFKQLLNNKGSVIFVTVLFVVAILLGTSMLFLVAQIPFESTYSLCNAL